MRGWTLLVVWVSVFALVQGWMWYLLYRRVTEISAELVRITGLLATPQEERGELLSALQGGERGR